MKVLVVKRGFECTQSYYLRREYTNFNERTNFAAGWSRWFDVSKGCGIALFTVEATPTEPIKPWFGPYSIEELLIANELRP